MIESLSNYSIYIFLSSLILREQSRVQILRSRGTKPSKMFLKVLSKTVFIFIVCSIIHRIRNQHFFL